MSIESEEIKEYLSIFLISNRKYYSSLIEKHIIENKIIIQEIKDMLGFCKVNN